MSNKSGWCLPLRRYNSEYCCKGDAFCFMGSSKVGRQLKWQSGSTTQASLKTSRGWPPRYRTGTHLASKAPVLMVSRRATQLSSMARWYSTRLPRCLIVLRWSRARTKVSAYSLPSQSHLQTLCYLLLTPSLILALPLTDQDSDSMCTALHCYFFHT